MLNALKKADQSYNGIKNFREQSLATTAFTFSLTLELQKRPQDVYSVAYLMKKKSESSACIMSYIKYVQNKLNRKINTIKCDNEYNTNVIQNYCIDNGIELDLTMARSKNQNMKAERKIRTLEDRIRTLLLWAKLPDTFWCQAAQIAVFIDNRIIRPGETKTPLELFTDEKINYHRMHTFGSVAYVHVPKEKRRKIDPTSRRCLFMSYENLGYRFYDPDANQWIESICHI